MAKALDRFDPNPKKNISLKTKLIAMIVGGGLFGILGMIFVVPVVAILRYLIKDVLAPNNQKDDDF